MGVYEDSDIGLNFYYYGDQGAPAPWPWPSVKATGAQIFADIVATARASGQKFEDPNFPATEASFGKSISTNYAGGQPMDIEWRRPTEIAAALFEDDPIFQGDVNQFCIKQGDVGDCWFEATLGSASVHPDVMSTLVPSDNNTVGFDSGAFHFRFWCRGKWVDIVVDDRLACCIWEGQVNSVLFSQPTKKGGFWAPLLEKAYAKLYGKYAYIDSGSPVDGMMDFTGGITQSHACDHYPGDKLKDEITKAAKENRLMAFDTLAIPPELQKPKEAGDGPGPEIVSIQGITGGHAYSLLDIQEVHDKNDESIKYTLVNCRNPWGSKVEWNGDFSDSDP